MHKWYSIESKAGSKSAKINIHEQIGKSFWSEGGVGARQFVKDLDALNVDEIQLHINSPGGNVFEGNTIYNALRQHPAKIVVTVDGIAASIASVIAMAGDRVIMPDNAMMMIHDPFDLVVGNSSAMRKRADALDKIKTSIVSAYMTRATEDQSSIEQMMTDETWLTADEAVQIGFADEVMTGNTEGAQNCAFDMMSQFRNVPAQILAMSGTKHEIEEKEEPTMALSLEQVKTEYPDIAGALIEEGRREGARGEMERIKSVRAQSLPGHEALIESMIDDGTTTGEQAAIRVLNAERQLRASAISNLTMDAEAIPNVPVTTPPQTETPIVLDLTTEDGMLTAWNRDEVLRDEFSGNFEIFKAYERNKHLAKVR
jgi:ATP-dependent Clp protease, protease subunit